MSRGIKATKKEKHQKKKENQEKKECQGDIYYETIVLVLLTEKGKEWLIFIHKERQYRGSL